MVAGGGGSITWEVNEQWQFAKVVIGCWVQQANTLQKFSDLSSDLISNARHPAENIEMQVMMKK